MTTLVVRSENVVTPDRVGPASIHIRNGVITAVAPYQEVPPDWPIFEAGRSVVMPGLVDTHVHINEPGRTNWEGFASATRAAAAGGVTTLVDMPLNSIPATTTPGLLQAKLAAARGQCWVDVGFWGGLVPGNAHQLRPLFEAGVLGFKCFLVPSGVEEFAHVAEPDLREALPALKELGAVLIVHAELPGPIDKASCAASGRSATEARKYCTFLRARPRAAENEAVELLVRLSREFRVRLHVVHHSSADALPLLRRARAEGLPISAETCPHYLFFAAEEVPEGATQFKCCPPIRERANQEELWAALAEGVIEMVVSDHSPCPPEMKRNDGDFLRAWGGIASLQLRLPVMWTAGRRRGFGLRELTEWLCAAPARLVGLGHRKGAIRSGADADLVIWDPEAAFPVEPSKLYHRHKLTPYAGQVLEGIVQATFLRGERVYDRGEFSSGPQGAVLKREGA